LGVAWVGGAVDDVPEEGLVWPVLLGDVVCATNQLAHSSSPDNNVVFAFMKSLHLESLGSH
jgi:hypothetical protein